MTARNVSDGGDHDGDRDSIGEGDANKGQTAVDVERLRVHDRGRQCLRDGEDRPGADEDERKGADELGEATPERLVIHRGRKLRGGSDGVCQAARTGRPATRPARTAANASSSFPKIAKVGPRPVRSRM